MSQTESSQAVGFRKEEREPSWGTDILGRKEAAHQLERLIANAPGPYVIAMTSEWGSGKTFFLKAWGKDLRDRHRPCVYFNAWGTDHAGDPLLALTGCITESLKANEFIAQNRLKKLATTASDIFAKSPQILCKMAFGAVNKAVDGALDEAREEILDAVELGTDLFLKNNARRVDFANQLAAIAKEASENAQNLPADPVSGTKHFPLFVMIDELDRCRPSYVIELLENIKHLFGVPGVVFLLAIDQEQVLSVIQHTFGLCDTNGRDIRQNYLRKFIDVFWRLPKPDVFSFALYNLKNKITAPPENWSPYCASGTINQSSVKGISLIRNKLDSFHAILAQLAENNTQSLRECIQSIDKFNIIYTAYHPSWQDSVVIFSLLFTPKSNEQGLKVNLQQQGVEISGSHSIEKYSNSFSSVANCIILAVCFGVKINEQP